ncbi:rRNA (guanine-N2)-methyltransferase [Halobacteriales archaeon QS_8_69_73]|nr:MAG: rRNA (guanine-N2)-methyltransferase [Halobacteriales archaeon QS_8_69_73]
MTPPGEHELALESRVDDARPTYRFRTADGVHSKSSFRDGDLLLLEELWDVPTGRLLCPEANYGVVGTVLAGATADVEMTESSARAARLCRRNAARNDADASVRLVADLGRLTEAYDTAAYAPKPYTPLAVGKRRIADSLAALRPGGDCYVAAADSAGAARYEACLDEIAGPVETVAGRDDCRLLRATRPAALDPPEYVACRHLDPTVAGVDLSLRSVPGLFAATGLDAGTRLLLENAGVADGERVLDLCSGYGAIGVCAASAADCEVWLSDDDRVATACAERSLAATDVDGTVVTADCTRGVADRTFDRILCNPPTHAGDDVLSALFAGARDVLAADGECRLVHHRTLDLSAHLAGFGTVEQLRTGAEHVVLLARPEERPR